jgi:hypothetical protein
MERGSGFEGPGAECEVSSDMGGVGGRALSTTGLRESKGLIIVSERASSAPSPSGCRAEKSGGAGGAGDGWRRFQSGSVKKADECDGCELDTVDVAVRAAIVPNSLPSS